jgi:Mg2+-importing ATPase
LIFIININIKTADGRSTGKNRTTRTLAHSPAWTQIDPAIAAIRDDDNGRRRRVGLLTWLLGCAMLAAVVVAALHLSEGRRFVQLAAAARPWWLLVAVALQLATYPVQGEIWQVVLRRSEPRDTVGRWTTCKLALARLFVDQALPSAGLSGTVVMAKALEGHAVPRATVMAGVVIDTASCYATYVVGLAAALAVMLARHQASRVVLLAALPFTLFALALAIGFLALSGRAAGALARGRLARVRPLARGLALLAVADPRLARRPRLLLEACACQAAIVLLDAATVWALIAAVGGRAPPAGVFASYMISTLFRLVGVVPGGLGTFEATSVVTLKTIGVDIPVALAATLLFRGLSFWLPMLPGLLISRRYAGGGLAASRRRA